MDPANVRPVQEGVVNTLLEAEKEAEATKQAIKRKIAQAAVVDFQSRSLPEKLRIDPNDPEDVVSMMNEESHFLFACFPFILQFFKATPKKKNSFLLIFSVDSFHHFGSPVLSVLVLLSSLSFLV